MSKSEFVIFMTSNASIFVIISIIFMIAFVWFLAAKAREIYDIMIKSEKIALMYESRINNIDKDSYSINKYNKATLEYIKEFREILISYKGKTFDTQLLKAIDEEMQEKLIKEKYKDTNNFAPKEEPKELKAIPKAKHKNFKIIKQNKNNDNFEELPFIESKKHQYAKNTTNYDDSFKSKIIVKNSIKDNISKRINKKNKIVNNNVDNFHNLKIPNKQMYCIGNTQAEIEHYKKCGFNILPENSQEEYFTLTDLEGWNNG